MSGHSSSHSNWNEMKFSLTSICTQHWITPREKRKKKKKKKKPSYTVDAVRACLTGRALSPLVAGSGLFLCMLKTFPFFFFLSRSLKSRVKIMVDGTLLVSGLIPEDSGNYTCMPTNGLLTPPTASANLTVMRTFLCVLCSRESSWVVRYCFSLLSDLIFVHAHITVQQLGPTTKGFFEHIKTVLCKCSRI